MGVFFALNMQNFQKVVLNILRKNCCLHRHIEFPLFKGQERVVINVPSFGLVEGRLPLVNLLFEFFHFMLVFRLELVFLVFLIQLFVLTL